ncbi:MAG: hypothetical protein JWN51_2249 [Phycisphaerales bacterium]|nr:hypothetical protein [Phycisphaerales bacterium]
MRREYVLRAAPLLSSLPCGDCSAPLEGIFMASLHISFGDAETRTHELSGAVVIGRVADCDLMIEDREISRRHSRVEQTAEGWLIADLGSKNGTLVDGGRVERHVLVDGDVVRLGNATLTFRADQPLTQNAANAGVNPALCEDDLLAALIEDVPSPGVLESGDTRRLADEADFEREQMLRELAPDPSDYIEENPADPAAPETSAASPVASTPPADGPKYRGPQSWGAALTAAAQTPVASASPPARPAAAASNKKSKNKPGADRAPSELLASVKRIFATDQSNGKSGDPWYRRQVPVPAFYAVAGALLLWVVWGVYSMFFTGPSRAAAHYVRPASAQAARP